MSCKVSELSENLPSRFTASDRLQNFPTAQSVKLLNSLQQNNQQASQTLAPHSGDISVVDLTDGFRVAFANGDIVHLRPSGNAPELRCYAESDSQENAQLLCNQCLANLVGY